MRLWRDNKLSGAYELAEQEIAQRFLASSYAELPWRLERSLAAFMTAADGLSSSWEDRDAFERVEDIVLGSWFVDPDALQGGGA